MTEHACILAIDIGTSAARGVLFDAEANVVSVVRKAYSVQYPQPGWSEQNPDTVADAVILILKETMASLATTEQLHGVVFSSQMYSILALDRDGKPLSHSLTWGDVRSASIATSLRESGDARNVIVRTGCPIQAIYPLSKILWLKQNLDLPPDVRFVSIKDYVLFRLTGKLVTDWSVASASGLLDIAQYTWDETALSLCGITPANLPELLSPRHILTTWSLEIVSQTGLPHDTPLILGGGDAPLANIGVGAIQPGSIAVNVGTSAAARALMDQPKTDTEGRLWTYVADVDRWTVGGIIGSGGAVYEWWLQKLLFTDSELSRESLYQQADELAASVPAGSVGLLFIPHFTGEQSPGWIPEARGGLYGMTFQHERPHIIRAVLEGLSYSLLRVARTIEVVEDAQINTAFVTGGLTASQAWLGIITDVLGTTVARPLSSESSARGAAIIGWLTLGHGSDYADFHPTPPTVDRLLHPDSNQHAIYEKHYRAFCSLNKHLQKIYQEV